MALGLDVSKLWFDVCLLSPGQKPVRSKFSNNLQGFKQLRKWLHGIGIADIHACLEPTGPYSRALAKFLFHEGIRVSQVNSYTVQCHGRSKNIRSKTDKIDAFLLADFCLKENPPAWEPPSELQEELREIQHRLACLDELIQQERNRMESAESKVVQEDLKESLGRLYVRREMMEATVQKLVKSDEGTARNFAILKSISGIGDKTAIRLLALVQFDRFNNGRQVGCFAGLSPKDFESGSSIRKKSCISRMGNSELRAAMYFPAMVAKQHNPHLREFADRLEAKNKPPKVILCAIARKLLVLATTLIRKQEFYDPGHRSLLST